MEFAICRKILEVNIWKKELDKISKKVIVGECREGPAEYYISTQNDISIGVICEKHGLSPKIAVFDDTFIVGVNFEIIVIDQNLNVINIINDTSIFYEMLYAEKYGVIIGIFELSIVCISENYNVKWKMDFDEIISGFCISDEQEYICIELEEDKVYICIDDGQIKRN